MHPQRPAEAAGPVYMSGRAGSTTRRLLRRLRDIMAGSGAAQERLDKIVRVIAAEMVAEVCSIYVMRAGEVLELFATEGLHPEAVHAPGCGSARAWSATIAPAAASELAEARAIPNSPTGRRPARRSSTRLGVPILRSERALGVLAVQNRTLRLRRGRDRGAADGGDGRLRADRQRRAGRPAGWRKARRRPLPMRLGGLRFNRAWRWRRRVLHEPRIVIHHIVAEDIEARSGGLRRRRGDARADRRDGRRDEPGSGRRASGGARDLRCSPTTAGRADQRGDRSGLTAEAAIERVRDDTRPHDADRRSLSAGADARPRGPRQPAAAHLSGPHGRRRAERADRTRS